MRIQTYKVEFTDEAIADIREIGVWIARDSHEAAERVVRVIIEAAWSLAQLPRRGRLAPEWRVDENETRQLICLSHRIVYTIRGNGVLIITVIHGSRENRRTT